MTPWHGLQLGSLRCCSSRARSVFGCSPSGVARFVSTSGGGGVGGVPMSLSSTQAPRSTGDVRSPYDVRSSTAPLPSSPWRAGSVERHAPELRADDAVDAVVPREPLVEERVVGRQQLARCGPRAARSRGTARSPSAKSARSASVNSGNSSLSGCTASSSSRSSQPCAKFVTSTRRAGRPACARLRLRARRGCASLPAPRARAARRPAPGSTERKRAARRARTR